MEFIVSSNCIFDGIKDEPFKGWIGVKANKIIKVSQDEAELLKQISNGVKHYAYGDQLVMAGIHDFHLHIMPGALQLDCFNLIETTSAKEAAQVALAFDTENPDRPWVIGFSWDNGIWDNPELPNKSILDEFFPEKPVVLIHLECHYSWVNSKALEIIGVTKDTPNPAFGIFEKDKNGELTGIIYERAQDAIFEHAYQFSPEKKEQLLSDFLNFIAKQGITSVNDLYAPFSVMLDDFSLYTKFEQQGRLSTRIFLQPPLDGDLKKAKEIRESYQSPKVQFNGLKQFLDGVITGYTGYLSEPYSDNLQTQGELTFEPETIFQLVADADQESISVRFHAIGDGAVKLALDSFQYARQKNGRTGTRHTIEHIETIRFEDVKRFAELDVIASVQPYHMAALERSIYESRIGEKRMETCFLLDTLRKTGARVGFGSDFPVVPVNPFLALYHAVTRMDSNKEPWHLQEAMSLSDAIRSYTIEPAFGSYSEEVLGTISEGKLADFIVLDRNLFTRPKEEIVETNVVLTVADGEIVYEQREIVVLK